MDAQLALRVGVQEKLAELYAEHAPGAGKLAFLLTGDRELAEDLVQEAFARVAHTFGALRHEEAFAWYLRKTVVNLARRHWRRTSRERAYARDERTLSSQPIASVPDVDTRDALWRAMNKLPYRQRAAIALRFYEDLSEREIASVLRCAPGTVKSLVSRGLKAMNAQLGGQQP